MMAVTLNHETIKERLRRLYFQLKNAALDDLVGSTSTSWCDPLACL